MKVKGNLVYEDLLKLLEKEYYIKMKNDLYLKLNCI